MLWIFPLMAPPADGGDAGGGLMSMALMMMVVFGIFYFLVILPQRKQQKAREAVLASIKKGDKVVTSSGMFGTVVGLKEDTVILKIDDQVKVRMQRAAVANVVKD
jgi:preprotein translocase subunit YajC